MLDTATMKAIGTMLARQARSRAAESDVESNEVIDLAPLLREWKPGRHQAGDVVTQGGFPWRCVQSHDSTANPDWTPQATPALWANYHGTDAEHALPWVQPTGAHDMYLTGEYMVFTDGLVYHCIMNTNFSPTEYAQAWEVMN